MNNACRRSAWTILWIGMWFLPCRGFSQTQHADDLRQSGPMIGHVSMRTASVWLQTTQSADVWLDYQAKDAGDGVALWKSSDRVRTDKGSGYTALIELDGLEPGETYVVKCIMDGHSLADELEISTQPLWDYRMDPPAFKVATGSCAYINEEPYDRPGKSYGGDYHIFESMAAENPDMMLWLGDNIYLREVDFQSYSGFLHRYTHTRSTPEMASLLRACPNYAIWDDHDFGPNDADGSWVHSDWSRESFESFWANPSYGIPQAPRGVTTAFRFVDMEFFLLDNRTYRVDHHNKTQPTTVLGQAQIDWLIQALVKSRAPYKFVVVGGQVLSDAAVYENVAQYPEERAQLLQRIEEEDIRGVVFLSGDRHTTELSTMVMANGRRIHDLTVSPLTSGPGNAREEPNSFRVEGTYVDQRNYAILSFEGPRKERVCTVTIKDSNGKELWSQPLDR